MPEVRWVVSCEFYSKFNTRFSSAKFWKPVKVWQSYREFKGGNVFETQCIFQRRTQQNNTTVSDCQTASVWKQSWLELKPVRNVCCVFKQLTKSDAGNFDDDATARPRSVHYHHYGPTADINSDHHHPTLPAVHQHAGVPTDPAQVYTLPPIQV